MTAAISTKGQLTGRKVTAIFVVFFGVIMVVNFTMAHFASSTFGGVVVSNSYVASQHYNKWLAAAEAQKKLGWSATLAAVEDQAVELVITDRAGRGVEGLTFDAKLKRPATEVNARELRFAAAGEGRYVAPAALSGAWDVIVVATGPNGERFATERRLVAR